MRSLLLVVVVFASACIEPTLRFCDDAACPVSTTCVNGAAGFACVDDSLLAACSGASDGTTCTTEDYNGLCRDGICVRPSCGDGFAADPEPCEGDDLRGTTCANVGRYAGTLKCTSACTLDPSDCGGRCGDGTRNGPEVCEGSDLGGVTCLDLGFYGGTLACSDDCTFDTSGCIGTCGDGTINGAEACEGANLGGHSCADVGRYRGAVDCNTVCGVNYTACEGECGDAVVDSANGEQCDTTPPATSCLSLGYDIGRVGCSQQCETSTSTCGRFGWEYVGTIGLVTYAWSDGSETLALQGDNVIVFKNGVLTTYATTGVFQSVAASSDGIVVLHQDGSLDRYKRSTSTWSMIPAPTGYPLSSSGGVDIDESGAIYVSAWECTVWVLQAGDTEWQIRPPLFDTGCSTIAGRSATDIWAREHHLDAGTWGSARPFGFPAELEVFAGPAGSALAATGSGAYQIDANGETMFLAGNVKEVEHAFGRACASVRDGQLYCMFGTSRRMVDAPPGLVRADLIDGPPNSLTILVDGDLWTTRLANWERIDVQTDKMILDIAITTDGASLVQRDDDHIIDLGTGNQLTISDAGYGAKFVFPYGDHWLQLASDSIFELPRDGSDRIEVATVSTLARAAWTDGQMMAVIDSVPELNTYDMSTTYWGQTLEPNVTFPADLASCVAPLDIEGHRLSSTSVELFVLFPCNVMVTNQSVSVVMRFANGTWSQYYRTTDQLEDLLVPPGDSRLLALGPQSIVWLQAGAVVSTQTFVEHPGYELAAHSATEIYVVGTNDEFGRPLILRWSGTSWDRVRAPLTQFIRKAAITPEALVFVGDKIDRLNRFGF